MMNPPIDVGEGNRRRKQLLEKLAQQQQMRPGGAARPVFGGGRPFFSFGNLPAAPRPQLTRPFPIPPGLAQRLGPGATQAVPQQAGDYSPALGVSASTYAPAQPGPPPVGAPSGGHVPGVPARAGGSIAPLAAPAPQDAPAQAGRNLYGVSGPETLGGPGAANPPMYPEAPAPPPIDYGSFGSQAMQELQSSGNLIPMGGGAFYNAATGQVQGAPALSTRAVLGSRFAE